MGLPQQHQHHSQDEYGRYIYGYANEDSTKVETKSLDGIVRGSYSYVDANGKLINLGLFEDCRNIFTALPSKFLFLNVWCYLGMKMYTRAAQFS